MTWETVFSQSYTVDASIESITLPITFLPYFRLIISTELITGLGRNENFLGTLIQQLAIPNIGAVKGKSLKLSPSLQLLTPATEFPYTLIYQPVKRHFSFTLTIQSEETIPASSGSENAPVLAAITLMQTTLNALVEVSTTMPLTNSPSYPTSSVAASTTVASSTTSVSLLAINTSRKGATVWNASTATLYLDLDAAASLTDYAARLDPGGYYEVPYGFTGAIAGIWSAVNGNALVREFT